MKIVISPSCNLTNRDPSNDSRQKHIFDIRMRDLSLGLSMELVAHIAAYRLTHKVYKPTKPMKHRPL